MLVFITDCFEVLYLHLSVQCIIMFDFLLTLFFNKQLTPALVLLIENTNILFALYFKMLSGPIIFMCEEKATTIVLIGYTTHFHTITVKCVSEFHCCWLVSLQILSIM